MTQVFVGLGSNVGDRLQALRDALGALDRLDQAHLIAVSHAYENRAIGMGEADDFINAVAELSLQMQPQAFLSACLAIEQQMGRTRGDAWLPRTIDIDVLLWGRERIATDALTVPHPRLLERDFVVLPLLELAPDLVVGETRLADAAAALDGQYLRRLDTPLIAIHDDRDPSPKTVD